MSTTTTIRAIHKANRGLANLGGIVKLELYQASDFTDNWPKSSQVVAGEVTVVPPLKATATPVVLTFDIGTCKVTTPKSGTFGYETYAHSAECKSAGIGKDKAAALHSYLNEGVVAIATNKEGERQVLGQSAIPLQVMDEPDTGAKGDDGAFVSLKLNGTDRYGWGTVFIADSVTMPVATLPATGTEPTY
ncbi:MAG: hypothetical protein ACK4UP_05595 [Spirosomataceae bacterium]